MVLKCSGNRNAMLFEHKRFTGVVGTHTMRLVLRIYDFSL